MRSAAEIMGALDEMVASAERAVVHERLVGILQVGSTRLTVVVPIAGPPVIRSHGRDLVLFTEEDPEAAEAHARQVFERLVRKELVRVRTHEERKRLLVYWPRAVAKAVIP